MHPTIRANITYGFVILALGMMLTDVCRLMRTPLAAPLIANNAQRVHKF
jgi:hypothetical protein